LSGFLLPGKAPLDRTAVRDRVEDRAQLRFAIEQRRVLALYLGDVAGDFRGADDPSGVVAGSAILSAR
jgi:hypothetical protein